jgi:hypothetical protein
MASKPFSATDKTPPANCRASILRDDDKMRLGISAAIKTAATQTLVLSTMVPHTVGEAVRVECENVLMRFRKRVEGTVTESTAQSDGVFLVTIDLRLRLTPNDVRMLRPRERKLPAINRG